MVVNFFIQNKQIYYIKNLKLLIIIFYNLLKQK